MSGQLDHNPNLGPNRNPNPKEGKRERFQLEFVFESYFEVDDEVWGELGWISEERDSFVSDDIFLLGRQNGATMGLYRSI